MKARLPAELTSTRLRLRQPHPADARAIFAAYTQDPLVCRYMIWSPHASLQVTEAFIASCIAAWAAGTRLPYVITGKEDDAAIGMLEARPQGTTLDIGYVLARAHWGQGLMPEAIAALTDAALATPAFFRVQAGVDTENRPSQRALEKAGFLCEGRLERFTVHPNISPEPRACYMYASCR